MSLCDPDVIIRKRVPHGTDNFPQAAPGADGKRWI